MDCSAQCAALGEHKLVVDHIEQLVASTLLSTQRHNYSGAPPVRRGTILPHHIQRAKDYVKAHAHEPIPAEQPV
ncbi:hypothetical protein [Burkholderia catarinensis]|uniref:hypothetical protein n=1 Tax=Burkholderia catarinensis TaxID=1108140 RepID=UPI00269179C6|nr:hypothetical protein [Burkholderia catarinensis]